MKCQERLLLAAEKASIIFCALGKGRGVDAA
jgi:hypothetical protein